MTRLLIVGVLAAAAGTAGGAWAFGYGPFAHHGQPAAPAGTVPVATATVSAGTITSTEEDPGTIGYQGSFTVYSNLAGTVTWLPGTGAVIRPGGRLFAVGGQDVTLLRGQTPAWRPFGPGMSSGPDVAALQRNLIALGYDPYHAITPDGQYDWATQAAVERWQAAEGWIQDGQITLGQVAFLPGPIRVSAPAAGLGASVAPGTPVLTATSTAAVVNVTLPSAEQPVVTPGQRVAVTLPDGSVTTGHVLGPAPAPSGSAGTPPSTGGSASPGGSASGQATVSILVMLDHQPAARLDGSPVQVAITTQAQRDALVAPISALLARPGGGFQVTVVAGSTRRNVTVRTGLFDDTDGTVAISGPGIIAGTRVEVPRS